MFFLLLFVIRCVVPTTLQHTYLLSPFNRTDTLYIVVVTQNIKVKNIKHIHYYYIVFIHVGTHVRYVGSIMQVVIKKRCFWCCWSSWLCLITNIDWLCDYSQLFFTCALLLPESLIAKSFTSFTVSIIIITSLFLLFSGLTAYIPIYYACYLVTITNSAISSIKMYIQCVDVGPLCCFIQKAVRERDEGEREST